MTTTLPTTPGSIVRFLVPQPDSEPLWHVATLIAGAILDDGTVDSLVWASAYIENPEDRGNVFSEEFIMAHEWEVVLETVEARLTPHPTLMAAVDDVDFLAPGLVVRVWDELEELWMTYTYAPGFQDTYGAMGDFAFVNSYGGFIGGLALTDDPDLLFEIAYLPTAIL